MVRLVSGTEMASNNYVEYQCSTKFLKRGLNMVMKMYEYENRKVVQSNVLSIPVSYLNEITSARKGIADSAYAERNQTDSEGRAVCFSVFHQV